MLSRALSTFLLLVPALFAPGALPAQATDTQVPPPSGRQVVRPGDMIRLGIWREPDMSGEFQVDEAGVVVFPRLGEVRAVDYTPESLRAYLLVEYRRFLRNPSIDIVVLRRVRIMGAVQNPGLYSVDPTVSIADALAMAGGATPLGDPTQIRLLRDGGELRATVSESTPISDSPIRSGDVIFVPERSWWQRNQNLVRGIIAAAASLTIALFLR